MYILKVTLRTKSHNFSLNYAPRDKHKKNSAEVTIYLEYRHGSTRKRLSTMVKVPKGSWSVKKRVLDLKSYPHLVEAQERLDEIMSKTYAQAQLLSKKKISSETALDEILQRMPDESLMEYYDEWYKKTKGVAYSTYEQRRGVLQAIQNRMVDIGRKEYSVLKFEHFADSTSLERIANIIKSDAFGLEPNGAYNYLKKLDEIYNKKYKKASPFKSADLRGKYEHPEKWGVEFRDLLVGIAKINTLQDLEAYLFYLYSLCLRGLNGKDIFRMRDEDFIGADDSDYIPNSVGYEEKQHYKKRRGKSNNKMQILSNLYPTLHIKRWLQWVLEIERPHLVKRDNEGEALFRKFNDEEVYKHWSIGLRTRYTEHLKKLIGNGLNSARHTYTQNGQDIDIPTSKLQSSLGQVPNDRRGKSIRSYARDRVEELDLIHIDVLDNCEIVELYFQLVDFLQDRKPFRGKRKTFFPKWFMKRHMQLGYMKGERLGLQGWTYKDEFKLQRLERKHDDLCYLANIKSGKVKRKMDKGGSITYFYTLNDIAPLDPPKELQELREKKARIEKEKYEKEIKDFRPETEPLNYQGEAWYDADGNLLDPKDQTGFI